MPYGKSYGAEKAPGVPLSQRRQAAKQGRYNLTKVRPGTQAGTGHLGTVASLPNPKR